MKEVIKKYAFEVGFSAYRKEKELGQSDTNAWQSANDAAVGALRTFNSYWNVGSLPYNLCVTNPEVYAYYQSQAENSIDDIALTYEIRDAYDINSNKTE